jgi:tetratricopeptide (TPR) repeat protein
MAFTVVLARRGATVFHTEEARERNPGVGSKHGRVSGVATLRSLNGKPHSLDSRDPRRWQNHHGRVFHRALEVPLSKICYRILLLSKGGSRSHQSPRYYSHMALAYQCIQDNPDARKTLDSLRSKHLPIDDNVGVGFLFDKLLRGPLNQTKKDVFIVLDGLDEADRTTMDTVERPPRYEMEILLEHLSTLASTRLLLISRPEADIKRLIPTCILKPLGKDDNKDDIDTYVKEKIDCSKALQKHFDDEKLDPLEFFHQKANGIFLVVLHQLSQTKTRSTFKKYIKGFEEASGDMEGLYSSVLSRIVGEDEIWIREILKWVVVAQRKLDINELREAMEWSLQDKHSDFRGFLEVEGGSLVHIIPEQDQIELVHETLKSFVVNAKGCPPQFYVDEVEANYDIAQKCLGFLSSKNPDSSVSLLLYAVNEWHKHLYYNVEKSKKQPRNLLVIFYRFFHSGGCKSWVRQNLVTNQSSPGIEFDGEEEYLLAIWNHLERWDETGNDKPTSIEATAIIWRLEVLEQPSRLGEYVGKAAGEVWLLEQLRWSHLSGAFRIALKYYCRCMGRQTHNVKDFRDLASNDFDAIVAWVGAGKHSINSANLVTGFYWLQLWSEAAASFGSLSEARDIAWERLAECYMNLGDYDNALQAFKKVDYYLDVKYSNLHSLAHVRNRDIKDALAFSVISDFLSKERPNIFVLSLMGEIRASTEDYKQEIVITKIGFSISAYIRRPI